MFLVVHRHFEEVSHNLGGHVMRADGDLEALSGAVSAVAVAVEQPQARRHESPLGLSDQTLSLDRESSQHLALLHHLRSDKILGTARDP